MNADVLRSYLPLYKEAALLTVRLGAPGIALAFLIGFVCASVLYSKIPVLRAIVHAYIEHSRNTPLPSPRGTTRFSSGSMTRSSPG